MSTIGGNNSIGFRRIFCNKNQIDNGFFIHQITGVHGPDLNTKLMDIWIFVLDEYLLVTLQNICKGIEQYSWIASVFATT